MPDHHGMSASSSLDTEVTPLGERALRTILDHVVAVGDEAETTHLEIKSALDMTDKTAAAKIAKFLLGAANRRPEEASKYFHGYAVLVIGAAKGVAAGVPRGTEPHELEDRLRPYLGPQFPAFEFGRVTVDSEHEVLFIIAQPPKVGQTIYPCHKDFQGGERRDNLADGAIYVRGSSNTRPARAGEVLSLVERARGDGKPPIRLEVEVVGSVHRVERVVDVLETLRDFEEQQFNKEPEPTNNGFASTSFRLASSVLGGSTTFTADERELAVAEWQRGKPEHIAKGREHFLGVGLSGAGIRVISRDRFVSKPHLIVTFHDCELIDYLDPDEADYAKAVEPVVKTQYPFGSNFDPSSLQISPRNYPVAWSNHGEVAEVVLTPESFRPNVQWASDQDDYVVLARDPQASSVEVSWILTEDGNDTVTSGAFTMQAAELVDAAQLFEGTFFSED